MIAGFFVARFQPERPQYQVHGGQDLAGGVVQHTSELPPLRFLLVQNPRAELLPELVALTSL